jgi:hypothetical protein
MSAGKEDPRLKDEITGLNSIVGDSKPALG